MVDLKSEIRSTKYETNTKSKIQMTETPRCSRSFRSFVLWICFGFRISDFVLLGVFSDSPPNRLPQRFAHAFDRDAVENLLEEARYNHTRRFFARQAAGLEIKDRLVVHSARGGAVRAAHVVGLNFQAGDRVGPGVVREHQVVVALVTVGL